MNTDILEKLVKPVTSQQFFDDYWENRLLHISRNDQAFYKDILTLSDVDNWLQTGVLEHPTLAILKGGRIPPNKWAKTHDKSYKSGKQIDREAVLKLLRSGATLLVNHFSDYQFALNAFMNSLRSLFQTRINDYLVISPPHNPAYPIHHDYQEVFVLHISGKKQWNFFDTFSKNLRDEHVRYAMDRNPSIKLEMQPGDFLYIPSNLRHSTEVVGDETSISLSITINRWEGDDFFKNILENTYASIPNLRQKMPLLRKSTLEERQNYYQHIKEEMLGHIESLDFEKVFSRMQSIKNKSSQGSILKEMIKPNLPSITIDSKVTRNLALHYVLNDDGKVLIFNFLSHTLVYFKTLEHTLKFITCNEHFLVKDLPGFVTDEMRVEIIQELVDKGFLEHIS